jgi:nucleoside-diphosphate kinase
LNAIIGNKTKAASGAKGLDKRAVRGCDAAPQQLRARQYQTLTTKEIIMAGTRTFSIIKPDATRRNLTGAVTKMLEDGGLRVIASKRIHMSKAQAEGFYAVHSERPFFNDLVSFMISGPVVVQVLEGENAMQRNRDIMGATNPANAEPGTIRKELAESIEANSVHGSDSDENAEIEIAYFFAPEEIVG